MTYDQAQSPRLGQPTPVESTYVQIFDVDPATLTADLVEAAWPGQLIFRQDRSILQIYNGPMQAWQDVAGGIAGQLTYVGADAPTGSDFNLGDTWYDSDDSYQAYVWDGTAWVKTSGGIKTFYAPGWQGDPPVRVGPVAGSVGDLWYQTDDFNHVFRWNGTIWVDVKDGQIPIVLDNTGQNAGDIRNLGAKVAELSLLATSTDNTADTADGRVSMSDYSPGIDDFYYPATKRDPETGEEIDVLVPRVNGSIWFTRTRPRRNLCTNPSFETNENFWTYSGVTAAREIATFVPAGNYTLKVTNDAVPTEHRVSWGENDPADCKDGLVFTASCYAELISGVGAGVTLNIRWYDVHGVLITTSSSTPFQLSVNAFDPKVLGTAAEPRLKVTAQRPSDAVTMSVRLVSPIGNENDQWHCGELVLEQQDDLGRYFDGDSYDGVWDGVKHNSSSYLVGDKIIETWELRDGSWVKKRFTDDSINDLNAGKLWGTVSGGIIAEASMNPSSLSTTKVLASVALTAGDIVGFWSAAGEARVRPACAAAVNRQEAHGYVLRSTAAGSMATVYHNGYNSLMTGLTPGTQWLSTTPGKAIGLPPTTVGTIMQRIGSAPSPTVLNFSTAPPVWVV
jgi:hypothetical protein